MGEEAGSAGRSRRSLHTVYGPYSLLGAGAAVVGEGVGRGVETRLLARPPKGTQKKSLDAAVA